MVWNLLEWLGRDKARNGRKHARPAKARRSFMPMIEQLEKREMLSGNPVAGNDSYTVLSGQMLSVVAPGVLVNDTSPDMRPLSAVLVNNSQHGMVTLNGNGAFTYMPNFGYVGADSFTYKDSDGIGFSNVATVTFNVASSNPPTVTGVSPARRGHGGHHHGDELHRGESGGVRRRSGQLHRQLRQPDYGDGPVGQCRWHRGHPSDCSSRNLAGGNG